MSKVKEVISCGLFKEIMEDNNIDSGYELELCENSNSIKYWVIENPKYQSTSCYINIHELAIKIVDKMITLGYVASLTKIKQHWWCEFATENYYKNNGIMSHGSGDGSRDIDTKSDDVLSCAVKAYGWILENKGRN